VLAGVLSCFSSVSMNVVAFTGSNSVVLRANHLSFLNLSCCAFLFVSFCLRGIIVFSIACRVLWSMRVLSSIVGVGIGI
jgi:hypothetical protein